MMTHTPGPWRVEPDGDEYVIVGRPDWPCRRFRVDGEWEVARIDDLLGEHSNEAAANASLIEDKTVALEVGSSRPRRETRVREQLGRTVVISTDVLNALGPHAARRSISVNHLARLIVSTVVDESMVDAVLDDADSLDGYI